MGWKWLITYRVVGDIDVRTIEIKLNLKTEHKVEKWFNMSHNGIDGRKKLEFISAKKEDDKKND